jgi:hypothetical protein
VYEPVGAWFSADYLLWWTKDSRVQPLVTSAVPRDAGVIGPASAGTLFNGGSIDDEDRSGGRFTLGFWFQDTHVIGMEGSYFFLGQDNRRLALGLEDSSISREIMAPPGTYFVSLSSMLQSADINAIANLTNCSDFRLDFLAGFRFLELNEKLHVTQDFLSADFSEEDTRDEEFHTRNNFYGGQVGARARYLRDRFFVDLTGKVALGVTDQRIDIGGSVTQALTSDGNDNFGNPVQNVQIARSASGGLLAQPARFSRDYFTVIPEVNLDVGYQFTSFFRASVGYSFLFWSSVVRPGDQVSGVPKATSFWAQGLNFTAGFTF